MKFSQRAARSEIHFYIQKLTRRGYVKKQSCCHHGGYRVLLERDDGIRKDILTVKFSNNGWCSFLPGNHLQDVLRIK